MKVNWLKVASIASTIIGIGGGILSDWVTEQTTKKEIDERINALIHQINK